MWDIKRTWNKTVNVTEGTKKISAELSSVGGNNESEIALVFENPEGDWQGRERGFRFWRFRSRGNQQS